MWGRSRPGPVQTGSWELLVFFSSLLNFYDFILVTWNWIWWDSLYCGNWQTMQIRFVCLFTNLELAHQLTTGVGDFCLPKEETQSFSIFTCVIPTDPTPGQLSYSLKRVQDYRQQKDLQLLTNLYWVPVTHCGGDSSKGQSLALMVFTTVGRNWCWPKRM